MALRSAGHAAIRRGVRLLQPFRQGNVSGTDSAFYETGIMPAVWRNVYNADRAGNNISYAIRSYDTPIAWRLNDGTWITPDVKYSVSTTNHQNVVSRYIHDDDAYTAGSRYEQLTPGGYVIDGAHQAVADIDRVLAEVAAAGWTDPYSDPESPALRLAA